RLHSASGPRLHQPRQASRGDRQRCARIAKIKPSARTLPGWRLERGRRKMDYRRARARRGYEQALRVDGKRSLGACPLSRGRNHSASVWTETMIHPVFDRPTQTIKAFNANGSVYRVFRGEGDAWGHTAYNEYGHDAWMPPGHYLLGAPQFFAQPIASEGFGQIPI